MIPNHQSREQGLEVDSFLESKPVKAHPLALRGFNYAECTDCHHIIELAAETDLSAWKFSLMGLRPSILGVAKGICPECQDMRKTFKGILGIGEKQQ